MAQWINLHRNNSFVNWTRLSLFCEIFGAVYLALVGLMAGRLADEIQVNFEIFKNCYRSKYLTFCWYSVITAKACCKVVSRSAKNPEAIYFHSDPTVLNDMKDHRIFTWLISW